MVKNEGLWLSAHGRLPETLQLSTRKMIIIMRGKPHLWYQVYCTLQHNASSHKLYDTQMPVDPALQ